MGSYAIFCLCIAAVSAVDYINMELPDPVQQINMELPDPVQHINMELPDPVQHISMELPDPELVRIIRDTRIINGVTASPGEFPHQATLLNDGYHTCGASIIANGWALTAAHCVDGASLSMMSIVTDLHDFSNPGNSYQWFDLQSIIMHPSYDQGAGTYPNDIALLRLILEGRDTSRNAIAVASGSDTYAGQNCVVSGWGVTESGDLANALRKASVTVLSNSECQSRWSGSSASIISSHVCAMGLTGAGTGTCNGDSGGPLVCNNTLVGATSFGIASCHTNGVITHPSVFTRVSSFYSWLRSNCNNCV